MKRNVQTGDGSAPVFRFGEFTFDSGSRLLLRNGVRQHLSPKAQRLLDHLLAARPRAVAREELYDALWPETYVSETNLAGVVNELRRALGDDPHAPQYVRTVHGFGYAFCGDVTTSQVPASVTALLVCEGQSHLLQEGENTIGRAVGSSIMLMHPSVSRRHARIIIRREEIWIEDLGSKNGTHVGGEAIRSMRIACNQTILFGAVSATLKIRSTASTDTLNLIIKAAKRRAAAESRTA